MPFYFLVPNIKNRGFIGDQSTCAPTFFARFHVRQKALVITDQGVHSSFKCVN